ncbi:MAG: aldose 1-epimerase family protein [Bacteroidota bacterium]
MNITLSNSTLSVSVSPQGAELHSIQHQGREYLWQADPTVWGRHAPILFPVVGRLKGDQYFYGGRRFSMKQHGLARDRKFAIVSQTDLSSTLKLVTDTQTLPIYPFEFELEVSYQLRGNKIYVGYRVENPGERDLPFSIGGHPGFSCPIDKEEKLTDYQISFEQTETIQRDILEGGLLSGQSDPLLENSQIIPLDEHVFEKDALVLRGLKSKWVKLESTKGPHSVTLHFDGFPYLGIWAKPGAHFVCLEPWFGHADSAQSNGQLLEKAGIQLLTPGESFQCTYIIEIN